MSRGTSAYGIRSLRVKYAGRDVGTLALTADGRAAFSYDAAWLENGFSISPFTLPLEEKVFVALKDSHEGLFGVFEDSLPDAWGRLLVDRILKEQGSMESINVLDRLTLVGKSGMGALEYEPNRELVGETELKSLDYLAKQCEKLLHSEHSEEIDSLYKLGGSSGGARPKILTCLDGKEWIIKFPASVDSADCGLREYEYSVCARECGIDMTETKLFPSKICEGYFGTVRFDRVGCGSEAGKLHMATAAGLLEADFRVPCLDYNELMKLTRILTRENSHDIENMFRRACFNVFAHNRDDHAKNFAFLYDTAADSWRLAPAYDLTYSSTFFGEHTTSVDGNGKDPGAKELLSVGLKAGLKKGMCQEIIEEIYENAKALKR